jgi:hypothetical protein
MCGRIEFHVNSIEKLDDRYGLLKIKHGWTSQGSFIRALTFRRVRTAASYPRPARPTRFRTLMNKTRSVFCCAGLLQSDC